MLTLIQPVVRINTKATQKINGTINNAFAPQASIIICNKMPQRWRAATKSGKYEPVSTKGWKTQHMFIC